MANLPFWDDESEDAQEWDTIQLGPFAALPGVWDVEDGNVKRVVDIKKAPGRDGATIKDEGYENGRFRLVGQIIDRQEWVELQAVLDFLHPKKRGKASEPLAIYHPKLSALQVHSVRVLEISLPRLDNGIMTITIEVIEWTPQPKKAAKPKNQVVEAKVFNAVTGSTEDAADAYAPANATPPDGLAQAPGVAVPFYAPPV